MGGVRWSEQLDGHVSLKQTDFNQAWLEGVREESTASLSLFLQIDDMDEFAGAERRLARIEPGSLFECPELEGRMPVLRGQFELLAAADALVDELHLRMRYDVDVEDELGRHFHVAAFKLVENDPGYDSWADTTTLFAHVYQGWWTERGLWSVREGFSPERGWEVAPPAEGGAGDPGVAERVGEGRARDPDAARPAEPAAARGADADPDAAGLAGDVAAPDPGEPYATAILN